MLNANTVIKDNKAVIRIEGKADTVSSEIVYTEFDKAAGENCGEFEFDLSNTEYVCSATLRSFLRAQKLCNKNDWKMYITGASEGIKDVFEITGFSSFIELI